MAYPNGNSTNLEDYYNSTSGERVVQAFLMIVLALLSLAGNGIVAFIVILQQRLRSLSNILLANLACVDLVKSGILIPLLTATIITHPSESPLKGRVVCLILLSFSAFVGTVTVLAYVIICMDRYIAVVHPIAYKQSWKSKTYVRCLFVVSPWAITAIIVFPTYIATHINEDIGDQTCTRYRAKYLTRTTTTVTSLCIFIVSLFALIVLYALIFKSVRQLAKRRIQFVSAENSHRVEERARKLEINTAKTTAITVAAYIFLWILYMIVILLRYRNYKSFWLDFLSLFFQYTSGVINPFLYFARIKELREGLKRVLRPRDWRYTRSASMTERSRRVSSGINLRSPIANRDVRCDESSVIYSCSGNSKEDKQVNV
ncbi:histamine H2 receptor-like [Xenia sp. Carnegie-2017]|uniref:histamine H2 receptor-like n=1 Tax=Xenia sp. Carnegie-2017 TaxID=2897299 RepID=UPI001F03560B|nr:histamine H2 receptor-like [Xenia sp. Carnegie-2017]